MESEHEKKERHVFRKVFRLAVLAGLVGFTAKMVAAKKAEYVGLTESQARVKITEKLSPKLGDIRAAEVAGQVVPRLRERGLVVEDPIVTAVDDVFAESNSAEDLKAGGGSDTDEHHT